jgi:hypothetical protein
MPMAIAHKEFLFVIIFGWVLFSGKGIVFPRKGMQRFSKKMEESYNSPEKKLKKHLEISKIPSTFAISK